MEQCDKIIAEFKPTIVDNLTSLAKKNIGCIGEWEAYWISEKGRYKGQWMFHSANKSLNLMGVIPMEDLEIKET